MCESVCLSVYLLTLSRLDCVMYHTMTSQNGFWGKVTMKCTMQEVHKRWGIFIY